MNGEIVYRHPKGRFMVYRRTFPFGGSYCEAEMTPEQDKRGMCSSMQEPEITPGSLPSKFMPMSAEDEDRICALFREGSTVKEIAAETGFQKQRVFGLLNRKGLRTPVKKRVYTDEELKRVRALRAQGWTAEQIGKMIGRTGSSVRHALEYPRRGTDEL